MNQPDHPAGLSRTDPNVIAEFPCTQTQLRFWVLDQLQPGNPSLNVAVRWEIRGAFRSSTIEAAFRKIVQRHEILRTRFIERNGNPWQQVLDAVDFKMSVIDLRNMPAGQREQRILSIGEETASAPFDLARGGLFRVTLLMVENNRAFILITVHHICFDGWSIRVLGRELGEIASAIDAGRTVELPDLPLQYGDFALWQQEYMAGYGFGSEADFWRNRLKDAPYFEVQTDHPRPTFRTTSSNIIAVLKPQDFGSRIEQAARDHRVSLYAYGASVISAVLHRFTGATDILFDTQIAGREQSDLEPMIGVFINNLVMRLPVQPQASFEEHLRQSADSVLSAVNHQHMPFNKLVELINPVRDPSRNPLVSVNFNQSKAFLEDRRYGDFELISAPSQSPGAIYDISFSLVGRPSGWRMSIEYNTDLFEKSTMERLLQLWQDVYDQALNDPTAPLVPLTSPIALAEPAAAANQSSLNTDENGPSPTARDLRTGLPAATAIASAAEIAQRMGEIWTDVLELTQVAPKDNFFALGGHSLAAIRMLSRVRDSFGVKPDLAQLFKDPTLEGFSEFVFRNLMATAANAPVQVTNPWKITRYKTGTGPYSVYTLNHPFHYHRLANTLDDRISVYNVNMFGATVEETSANMPLEQIAAQVVEAMQVDVRKGGVALVGLCVNGVLALEVAAQLQAAGVDVVFTAMIDSWAPGYSLPVTQFRRRLWKFGRRLDRARYLVRKLLGGRIKPLAFLKEFKATRWMLKRLGIRAAAPTADETTTTRVIDFLLRATQSYNPQPSSSLMLFRSEANSLWAKGISFGWQPAEIAIAKVVDLAGWHEEALGSSGVRTLAASIENGLFGERR